jgi:hypothetical protein
VIDDKNKDLLINMFNWYSTGLYSLLDLMEKIKNEGLLIVANLPSTSKIKILTKSSVQRILRNPVYYGDFFWKGHVYKGTHEPLVNKPLWDKVQDVLDRFQNKKMLSKYNTLNFAFKGLITCGECGRNVTATRKIKPSGKEYVYYNCTKFNTSCAQPAVNEEELDKQVIAQLEGLTMPQEALSYVAEGLKQSLYTKRDTEDKVQERLEVEKNRLEKSLSTLYEDRLDGTITKDFYTQKSQEYEMAIKDLEEKIKRYTHASIDYYRTGVEILELSKNAGLLYKNATLAEKQDLLNFLLSNSKLKDKNLDVIYKKPFDKVYQRISRSDWRGLRDDFRTLDWIEIINGLGLNFGIKKLEHFLAEHDLLSVHNFNKY